MRKSEKTHNNKIRDDNEDIIIDANKMQPIIRECLKNCLKIPITGNLEEIDKSLYTCAVCKLNQEDINNLHRSIANNKTEVVIDSQKRIHG
jgi:DNA-binding transcriptional regulator/RsmH inhibitor MraZ